MGCKWGGSELVVQFMDNPSLDMYLHHCAYIASDNEHSMFLYTNQMTPQECSGCPDLGKHTIDLHLMQ